MRLANGTGSIVCLDKTGKKIRKPWAVRITFGWKEKKKDPAIVEMTGFLDKLSFSSENTTTL